MCAGGVHLQRVETGNKDEQCRQVQVKNSSVEQFEQRQSECVMVCVITCMCYRKPDKLTHLSNNSLIN